MSFSAVVKTAIVFVGIIAVVLTAAIIFGGPGSPKPMASINDPFKAVDFSDLPPLLRYKARDGSELAYRRYAPRLGTALRGSVVLVHGSSGSSNSMHVIAKALANAGYAAYALDMRGHGASGQRARLPMLVSLRTTWIRLSRWCHLPNQARSQVSLVAGASDEVFETAALEKIFRNQGQSWPVTLLPGIGHIQLTLNPAAVSAIVTSIEAM